MSIYKKTITKAIEWKAQKNTPNTGVNAKSADAKEGDMKQIQKIL